MQMHRDRNFCKACGFHDNVMVHYSYKMEAYRCASRKNVKSVYVCGWGTVIIGRALRRFPLCVCVCESRWSTSSGFVLLSRADTSGSLCTSRRTPERPARDSIHRRPSLYCSHTRTGDPPGRNTHRRMLKYTRTHAKMAFTI